MRRNRECSSKKSRTYTLSGRRGVNIKPDYRSRNSFTEAHDSKAPFGDEDAPGENGSTVAFRGAIQKPSLDNLGRVAAAETAHRRRLNFVKGGGVLKFSAPNGCFYGEEGQDFEPVSLSLLK